MKTFGIDISKYQANMDLARAKNEGVRFTIIRGAYGRSKDSAFESNYKKAKANGLGVGVYWWTRATSEATAKAEATYLINNVLDLILWIINFSNNGFNSLMVLLMSIMYLVINIYALFKWRCKDE